MISENDAVPDVLIRDLSPELHEALKERAERNRRSLSAEIAAIVERAVLGRPPMTLAEIDARRVRWNEPLTDAILEQARRERK